MTQSDERAAVSDRVEAADAADAGRQGPRRHSLRYAGGLLVVFAAVFAAGAIKPLDFSNWLMENVLTVAFVAALVLTRRRFPFSNVSYTLIFVFLCLHTLGAHYGYSKVPYDNWAAAVFGSGPSQWFGWSRNHYDRLVHFTFGLLMAYPVRELFCRVAGARGFWGYYLPLDLAMSFSMLYEVIEWAAAVAFGGSNPDMAYVGAQGDPWDAQKDMALATLGALITMAVVAFINWKFDKHFGEEMRRSLAVKDPAPLGEVRLKQMLGK